MVLWALARHWARVSSGRSKPGVLVLVLWARARRWALLARALGRCKSAVEGARALRGAESKLSCYTTAWRFQPQLRVRSVTALARVLPEACFELTRRAVARVEGYNRRGPQSRAAAQKQDNLIGPASIWLTRSIVPQVPPVVAHRTRAQRHRPGQIGRAHRGHRRASKSPAHISPHAGIRKHHSTTTGNSRNDHGRITT